MTHDKNDELENESGPGKYVAPRETVGDQIHKVVRSGLGVIPFGGQTAIEIFQAVFQPPLEQRKGEWMNEIGDGLRRLEAKLGCVVDDLKDNSVFIDTAFQATQAAIRTSQQEKREALRNAVVNAALPHAPDQSRQQIFINWIESFTVWHLRLLRLFADPTEWYRANNRTPPSYFISSSLFGLLTDTYVELKNERSLCDKLTKDLYNEGLLATDSLHTMMSAGGAFERRSTELGNQFLQFISEPLA